MFKTVNSIFFVCLVVLVYSSHNAKADEIVLCSGIEEEYVVLVNQKGECLEDEIETVITGSGYEKQKTFPPLANYKKDDKCAGEGKIREIGFDVNGNRELDKNEVLTSSGICNPVIAEESEDPDLDTTEN